VVEMVVALVKRFPIWTAIGVFALGGYLFRDFLSGNVGDLKLGDCVDLPGLTVSTIVKDVQHHPCGDLHHAEVFLVEVVPSGANGAFPGGDAFVTFVQKHCVPAYNTYTGRDFDTDPTYDIQPLEPTAEGWAKGDHTINCLVTRVDGTTFKGSVKAAR
jgi:putative regulator of septum formation